MTMIFRKIPQICNHDKTLISKMVSDATRLSLGAKIIRAIIAAVVAARQMSEKHPYPAGRAPQLRHFMVVVFPLFPKKPFMKAKEQEEVDSSFCLVHPKELPPDERVRGRVTHAVEVGYSKMTLLVIAYVDEGPSYLPGKESCSRNSMTLYTSIPTVSRHFVAYIYILPDACSSIAQSLPNFSRYSVRLRR